MKNKTLKFEVPEEFKERLRAVVKKQEEEKEMPGKIRVKKKRNWKKIAAYTAAGLAVVGAGIALAVKLKNGDDVSDSIPSIPSLDFNDRTTDLSVFGDGVGYDAKLFWDKDGSNIELLGVANMSLRDVNKMFDIINPDVYDVSKDTNWDEIIFVQH